MRNPWINLAAMRHPIALSDWLGHAPKRRFRGCLGRVGRIPVGGCGTSRVKSCAMTNHAPFAAKTVSPQGKRQRLLGARLRYWRIGLISAVIYAAILVTLNMARNTAQPARLAALLFGCAFFGAIMAAMFAYFEKKALARIDIDADTAYDRGLFRPIQVQTISVDGSRKDVMNRASTALTEYGAVIKRRDDAAGVVEGVTFQNWRSYGERLTISVTADKPCEVTIQSVPRAYMLKLVTNYGRSWEHVHALALHIETGAFPVVKVRAERGAIDCGDLANTPPAVMEAGAWQRLLALTVLYSIMLQAASRPDKAGLVIAGFFIGMSAELFAFFYFRTRVQNQQRSEHQATAEAMLNNLWPVIFLPATLMDLRQSWLDSVNVAALAVVGIFVMIAINRLREMKRERTQHASLLASREKADLYRQLAEAKLVALSAQIEPHFLFNTLASIQYLIRHDADKAGEMTSDLIRYLRLALPRMKQATARLADELELVRAYLAIMQIRMGARLTFTIDPPDGDADRAIPTMALITLVENAIKHGLERQAAGGTIHVSVGHDPADMRNLRLAVIDTGGGFSTANSGSGIGLANIRERLHNLYGDRASLALEANPPQGVKAILTIPKERT